MSLLYKSTEQNKKLDDKLKRGVVFKESKNLKNKKGGGVNGIAI